MIVTEVAQRASKVLEDLLAAIENIPAALLTAPKAIGEWSVKDVLGHIIAWEEEAANALATWKIGVEPDWNHIRDIDEFNASAVKEKRKQSSAKIIEQLKSVHTRIIENIKTVQDQEYAKRGGIPRWLVNLIIDHVDEHLQRIIEYKNTIGPELLEPEIKPAE
jgi:uncharacterized damage-inducible protein DinB